jgi:hypothetical protein
MIKEKKNPNNSIVIDRLKCINDYDEENIDSIVKNYFYINILINSN